MIVVPPSYSPGGTLHLICQTVYLAASQHLIRQTVHYLFVGTGKKGNKCYKIYYLADFFHGLKDIGIVDFMNKNQKKSANA